MHIPDGFLTLNTWVPAWLISIGGIGYCLRKATLTLKDKMIPLMGVMSAFVFVAQMVNFPVAGGTSGHLLGGVLAVVLLGPYAGAVVITVVLIVQCFIFQDGGLTTLGANIFNMSIVGAIGGYLIYNPIRTILRGRKGVIVGVAIAAWASVVLASCACAIELAISGTSPLRIVLPVMIASHMLIGIGESIITLFITGLILKVRPDLIYKT